MNHRCRVSITLIACLVVASLVPAAASAGWVKLKSGTARPLYSVSFVDTLHGWVVGGEGTAAVLRHTTNGGATWTGQPAGVHVALDSVFFVDRLYGWAVGENGVIIRTINGGRTWTKQASGTTKPLWTVYFTDRYYGWTGGDSGAIPNGGVMLRTTDGGKHWLPCGLGGHSGPSAIHFTSRLHGWAATWGKLAIPSVVLRSVNGGRTWSQVWTYTGGGFIDQFAFTATAAGNATHGWIAGGWYSSYNTHGGYILLRTVDAGCHWLPFIYQSPSAMRGVAALGLSDAWAVGDAGITRFSTDNGIHWSPSPSGTSQVLWSTDFIDAHHGWACGTGGVMLRWK